MSYQHIENLYKDQRILQFTACYALEKIHGTGAHVSWDGKEVKFFAGGEDHKAFASLFDAASLAEKFAACIGQECYIYGEAYGGKCQQMSATYGPKLRFIAFEVMINDLWLAVPDAAQVVSDLGLEFVYYKLIPTSMKAINAERDAPSAQAERNGMGQHPREGIVLRPPFEVRTNDGRRVVAKYKRDEFAETKTPKPVSAERIQMVKDAQAIADNWCTEMRLTHILGAFPSAEIEKTGGIIRAMLADIEREGKGEIEMSADAKRAIGTKTAWMFKSRLKERVEKP